MVTTEFAERYRLNTRLDSSGEKIIPGRPGRRDGAACERHLYFDGLDLCLMVLDGSPVIRSRWQALGGKLWLGDIGPDRNGKRVQDVRVTGIPPENARAAMRLARVFPRKTVTDKQLSVLKDHGFQPSVPALERDPSA